MVAGYTMSWNNLILAGALASCVCCSPIERDGKASKVDHSHGKKNNYQQRPPASLHVPAAFTAGALPTNGPYSEYFSGFEPTQTSVEPQPKVTDVTRLSYDLNMTDPNTIPTENLVDPIVLPPSRSHPNANAEIFAPGTNFSTADSLAALKVTFDRISALVRNASTSSQCNSCVAGLQAAQDLSFDYPWEVPSLIGQLCVGFNKTKSSICAYNTGEANRAVMTQVIQFANLTSLDGIMICATKLPTAYCSVPPISKYDASKYFNTTLPAPGVKVAPKPSGKTTKVLHLSDFHLDPRYSIGSEAMCAGYLCCRESNLTSSAVTLPAPRFGSFKCDTPYDLALAAMEAIPTLTGTVDTGFEFTIFTGDLVSHDNDPSLGRAYIQYTESVIFAFFKKFLGAGPTYAALGNHDSWPQALNALNSLVPTYLAESFSWNYNHLAALWQNDEWIDEEAANEVRTHYGAYSTITKGGLRIITLNTDFWYTANLYNYINMTDPDPSGNLKFVADELQLAENAGQRAWVVGHVLPGWDGSAALKNPSDLWYQIQARYSPHVLAATFLGHIHDEVTYNTYANNGTVQNEETALTMTWVGPSLTPLTNLNSGFRMYEVDTETFDIMEAHTWYNDVGASPALDSQMEVGPSYHYEYSFREAYGKKLHWPNHAPLNATWWHRVTERMEKEPALVNQFNYYQGRLSEKTKPCTSEECVAAKICYMRSGSVALGKACPQGYSSVQN